MFSIANSEFMVTNLDSETLRRRRQLLHYGVHQMVSEPVFFSTAPRVFRGGDASPEEDREVNSYKLNSPAMYHQSGEWAEYYDNFQGGFPHRVSDEELKQPATSQFYHNYEFYHGPEYTYQFRDGNPLGCSKIFQNPHHYKYFDEVEMRRGSRGNGNFSRSDGMPPYFQENFRSARLDVRSHHRKQFSQIFEDRQSFRPHNSQGPQIFYQQQTEMMNQYRPEILDQTKVFRLQHFAPPQAPTSNPYLPTPPQSLHEHSVRNGQEPVAAKFREGIFSPVHHFRNLPTITQQTEISQEDYEPHLHRKNSSSEVPVVPMMVSSKKSHVPKVKEIRVVPEKIKVNRSKVICRAANKNYWRKFIRESLLDEILMENETCYQDYEANDVDSYDEDEWMHDYSPEARTRLSEVHWPLIQENLGTKFEAGDVEVSTVGCIGIVYDEEYPSLIPIVPAKNSDSSRSIHEYQPLFHAIHFSYGIEQGEEDELLGNSLAEFNRVSSFDSLTDATEDPGPLAKATQFFKDALLELENSRGHMISSSSRAAMFNLMNNHVITSGGNNDVYYCIQAVAYIQIQRDAEAIEECLKAINGKTNNHLGFAYFTREDHSDAVNKYFLKSLQWVSDDDSVRKNIRVVYQKLREEHQLEELKCNITSEKIVSWRQPPKPPPPSKFTMVNKEFTSKQFSMLSVRPPPKPPPITQLQRKISILNPQLHIKDYGGEGIQVMGRLIFSCLISGRDRFQRGNIDTVSAARVITRTIFGLLFTAGAKSPRCQEEIDTYPIAREGQIDIYPSARDDRKNLEQRRTGEMVREGGDRYHRKGLRDTTVAAASEAPPHCLAVVEGVSPPAFEGGG